VPDGFHRRKKCGHCTSAVKLFSNICREDAGGSDSGVFFLRLAIKWLPQTFDHLFFPALVDFALQFFQAEVHHIVMMHLAGQPDR